MQSDQSPATEAASPRERILDAARRIFLDGPPEQATMDAVAQQAGMSKKTIYKEFKSQLELLAVLLAESVADFGVYSPPQPGADLELELYGVLVRMINHVTSPRSTALARLLISEVRRYPELVKHNSGKRYHLDALAQWLASPEVRKSYDIGDPHEAASMLFSMVIQDAAFRLMLPQAKAIPCHVFEARARRAAAVFLRGVKR